MAILIKNNGLFLHIPKTGGTWVRSVLEDLDLVEIIFSHPHSDIERTLHMSGHYPGSYLKYRYIRGVDLEARARSAFKFAFVRNPFKWYESYWRFIRGNEKKIFTPYKNPSRIGLKFDNWHPWLHLEKCFNEDFNEFMSNLCKHYPGYVSKMYSWYADPLTIDFIGKQENLEADLLEVFEILDINIDRSRIESKKINKSLVKPPEWDSAVKELVYKLDYSAFYKYNYGE